MQSARRVEQIANLADVPLDVQVELGRCIMTIAQILALRSGTTSTFWWARRCSAMAAIYLVALGA